VIGALRGWWLKRRKARAATRARAELRALNDHMLRDIGLTRCQIEALFR